MLAGCTCCPACVPVACLLLLALKATSEHLHSTRHSLIKSLLTSHPSLPCRATVTPGGAVVSGGVPTLQVVLVEAAAQRLPSGSHGHSAASFGVDMPVPVPHGRWDWEAHADRATAAGSRPPARFGGFLPGGMLSWLCLHDLRAAACLLPARCLPSACLQCMH